MFHGCGRSPSLAQVLVKDYGTVVIGGRWVASAQFEQSAQRLNMKARPPREDDEQTRRQQGGATSEDCVGHCHATRTGVLITSLFYWRRAMSTGLRGNVTASMRERAPTHRPSLPEMSTRGAGEIESQPSRVSRKDHGDITAHPKRRLPY